MHYENILKTSKSNIPACQNINFKELIPDKYLQDLDLFPRAYEYRAQTTSFTLVGYETYLSRFLFDCQRNLSLESYCPQNLSILLVLISPTYNVLLDFAYSYMAAFETNSYPSDSQVIQLQKCPQMYNSWVLQKLLISLDVISCCYNSLVEELVSLCAL